MEECIDEDDELTWWNLIVLFTVYILGMWKRNDLEPVDETTMEAAGGDDWSDVSSEGVDDGFSDIAPYVINKIELEFPRAATLLASRCTRSPCSSAGAS